MLYQLVNGNRDVLVARVRERASMRLASVAAAEELSLGVASFLSQLSDLLFLRHADPELAAVEAGLERRGEMSRAAAQHGHQLQRHGFTLAQVVHDYSEIGRCIVELATERGVMLSHDDFSMLSVCVEAAVAGAITEHASASAVHRTEASPGPLGAPMNWNALAANHVGQADAR